MTIGKVNPQEPLGFAPLMPSPLPTSSLGMVEYLGIYEDDTVLGLLVVEIGEFHMDILHLVGGDEARKALLEKILANVHQTSILDVTYVEQFTDPSQADLDYALMDLGFFPQEGTIQPLAATLGHLLQQPTTQSLLKKANHPHVTDFDQVPPVLFRDFRRLHPDFPMDTNSFDHNFSQFYVSHTTMSGALLTQWEQDSLVLQWLLGDGNVQQSLAAMMVGLCHKVPALPPDTNMVMYVADERISSLAEKLGFQPAGTQWSNRIYTYYVQ